MSDAEQLRELFQFLHESNPQVRAIALQTLLGHTLHGSPHRDVVLKEDGSTIVFINDLKLLCLDQPGIAHDAFRALINLSDSPSVIRILSDRSFLIFLISYTIHPPSILADLSAMLLANLSLDPQTCSSIVKLDVPVIKLPSGLYYPPQSNCATSPRPNIGVNLQEKEAPAFPLLIDTFVRSGQAEKLETEKERKGSLNFLGSVIANISTTPEGRTYLLTPRPIQLVQQEPGSESTNAEYEFPLTTMLPFTEHADNMRRGGVASIIKNCTFHIPSHPALLAPPSEQVSIPPSKLKAPGIDALPYILLPLAGPEDFDLETQDSLPALLQFLPPTKKRDPVMQNRRTHLDTLLLLCSTLVGREHLRKNGVYEVIKNMHLAEREDEVLERIERLVDFLQRDEHPTNAATVPVNGAGGEDEDEDDKIVEV